MTLFHLLALNLDAFSQHMEKAEDLPMRRSLFVSNTLFLGLRSILVFSDAETLERCDGHQRRGMS